MPYNSEKRTQSAEETRLKIYKSAERLFYQYDVEKVTIGDIVRAAGVAVGTFYLYFSSKDDLINSLIVDHVNLADNDYQSFIDSFSPETDSETMLLAFVCKIADELINVLGYERMRTLYRAQISVHIEKNAVMDYNRNIYKMIQTIIERGISRNEIKTSYSPEDISKHIMISYRGLTYEWCIRYPNFDLRQEAINQFKIFYSGLSNFNK